MTTPGSSCGPEAPAPAPRRLRRRDLAAGLLAGGAGALGYLARQAESAPSAREQDILRFLLLVEGAQAALYHAAVNAGRLRGELARFAEVAATDEDAHVRRLERLLGGRAAPHRLASADSARDPRTFVRTAIAVEEAATAAYIGQGGNVSGRLSTELAAILGSEGRHAAWIRDIAGDDPAPLAQDLGRSSAETVRDLRRLRLL
jgi:hypothetical protein